MCFDTLRSTIDSTMKAAGQQAYNLHEVDCLFSHMHTNKHMAVRPEQIGHSFLDVVITLCIPLERLKICYSLVLNIVNSTKTHKSRLVNATGHYTECQLLPSGQRFRDPHIELYRYKVFLCHYSLYCICRFEQLYVVVCRLFLEEKSKTNFQLKGTIKVTLNLFDSSHSIRLTYSVSLSQWPWSFSDSTKPWPKNTEGQVIYS